jgi:hypothetical protein
MHRAKRDQIHRVEPRQRSSRAERATKDGHLAQNGKTPDTSPW